MREHGFRPRRHVFVRAGAGGQAGLVAVEEVVDGDLDGAPSRLLLAPLVDAELSAFNVRSNSFATVLMQAPSRSGFFSRSKIASDEPPVRDDVQVPAAELLHLALFLAHDDSRARLAGAVTHERFLVRLLRPRDRLVAAGRHERAGVMAERTAGRQRSGSGRPEAACPRRPPACLTPHGVLSCCRQQDSTCQSTTYLHAPSATRCGSRATGDLSPLEKGLGVCAKINPVFATWVQWCSSTGNHWS